MPKTDYEFGELEDQIVEICRTRPIDYEAINKLLARGADLNRPSKYYDDSEHYWENMLSHAILGFAMDDAEPRQDYETDKRDFLQMLDFFIANGFDVTAHGGKYGDQCFRELGSRTEKFVTDAAKKLLQAGAVTVDTTGEDDTLRDLATGAYYDIAIDGFPEMGNLTFALYKILERAGNSKPYGGIQNFSFAEGGTVKNVYFVNPTEEWQISQKLFQNSAWICEHNQDLCFELDNCWLYVSKYCECYADTEKPIERLACASEHFPNLLGCKIAKVGSFKDTSEADKYMRQKLCGTEIALNLYYTRKPRSSNTEQKFY